MLFKYLSTMSFSKVGVGFSALAILMLSACGGGGPAPAAVCESGSGTGTLSMLASSGLPAGTNGAAQVHLDTTGLVALYSLSDGTSRTLQAGLYLVKGEKVALASPIVRTVYSPAPLASVCVKAGETVTIQAQYTLVPSSNKIWTNNSPGGTSPMQGFAAAVLGSSGSSNATVKADGAGGRAITFDRDGNLWVVGQTTADADLKRFPAATLGVSGSKTPDREVNISDLGCFPRANALEFDYAGNLWVSVKCEQRLIRFTPADLASSGTKTPSVSIALPGSGNDIAFDSGGNLWVANFDQDRVDRYNLATLESSPAAPALRITSSTPSPVVGPLHPELLAFDASGNLWFFAYGVLTKLLPANLTGSGDSALTPALQINLGVGILPEGMAFDEGGGLWMAGGPGKITRLAPAQLLSSSTAGSPTTPERVISSPDLGYANSVAFYPAPAGLPLFHSLP